MLKFSICWLGRHYTHVTGSKGALNTIHVPNLSLHAEAIALEYDPEDSLVEFQRDSGGEEKSSETFLLG